LESPAVCIFFDPGSRHISSRPAPSHLDVARRASSQILNRLAPPPLTHYSVSLPALKHSQASTVSTYLTCPGLARPCLVWLHLTLPHIAYICRHSFHVLSSSTLTAPARSRLLHTVGDELQPAPHTIVSHEAVGSSSVPLLSKSANHDGRLLSQGQGPKSQSQCRALQLLSQHTLKQLLTRRHQSYIRRQLHARDAHVAHVPRQNPKDGSAATSRPSA
jgi:hypothetical protein